MNKNLRPSIPATLTLMEEQEFGEMMEHVDDVNFALNGLGKNQPVQIRACCLCCQFVGWPSREGFYRLKGRSISRNILIGLEFKPWS